MDMTENTTVKILINIAAPLKATNLHDIYCDQ